MKTISLLTEADLPAAYVVEKCCHDFPWSEKTLHSNQGDRYLNLKLQNNDKLIGFAISQIVLDEATIFNLAVHPKYQQQGLGELLLTTLLAKLVNKHVTTVWLEVRQSNHKAISLYTKLGFNEVSIRRNYYPSHQGNEDAVIMAWYQDI